MADSLVDSRDGRCAHLGGCTARVSVGSLIVHDPRGHSPTAVRSTCAGGKSSLPHLSTVMRRFPRMLRGCGHGGLERPTTFPAHTWRRLCAPRAAALPDARAPAPPIDAAATALQAQPPAAIVTAAAAASGGLPGRSVPPRAPPLGASLVEAAAGQGGGLTARRGHRAAAAAHVSAGRHDLTTCACPTPATSDSKRRVPAREGCRCRGGGDHRRSCSLRVWDSAVGGGRVVCRRRNAFSRTSLQAPLALMIPSIGRPRSPARALGPAPPTGSVLTADGHRLAVPKACLAPARYGCSAAQGKRHGQPAASAVLWASASWPVRTVESTVRYGAIRLAGRPVAGWTTGPVERTVLGSARGSCQINSAMHSYGSDRPVWSGPREAPELLIGHWLCTHSQPLLSSSTRNSSAPHEKGGGDG